ncbi:MAG TPA: serine hydrolase [Caulobacterales bacterium]|nr:serine hydrolase [Caulobacterales bacterium]
MQRRAFLLGAAALAFAGEARALDFDFTAAAAYSAARRGVSLLVMRDGRVLFEDYPDPGGAARAWELASGTKSFTGVIAAAAVQDGLLSLDEPAAETLTEWRDDPLRRRITIHNLLSLNSGLRARGQRPPSYAGAVATPAQYPPGTRFEYGPAPFQAFGEIMRRKLRRDADPLAYLQRRVLAPIGVHPAQWSRGRDGMPLMPQGAHVTARDWATFGHWVMQGGRGLVDRAALEQCFVPSPTNPGYGMSWWLIRPGLIPPSPLAGVSDIDAAAVAQLGETVMAAGAGDQRLYLLRERGVLVARQARFRGMLRSPRWRDTEFLRTLLRA